MLHPDLDSPRTLHTAVGRVQSFIDRSNRVPRKFRSILVSPRHVAFVELCEEIIVCTELLPLLTDFLGKQCSPGFRLLTQVLSSDCWKENLARREKWPLPMSPEVLSAILHNTEPRDAIAFAQASFHAERWYYATLPQFKDVSIPSMDLSIPCCGDRTGLENSGVQCGRCRVWKYQQCIALDACSSDHPFICAACLEEDPKATQLTPGGISRHVSRTERRMCAVKIDGSVKALRVRLSKPRHLRPELRLVGDLIYKYPKNLVDLTIRFNGDWAGLAYGLDDIPLEQSRR